MRLALRFLRKTEGVLAASKEFGVAWMHSKRMRQPGGQPRQWSGLSVRYLDPSERDHRDFGEVRCPHAICRATHATSIRIHETSINRMRCPRELPNPTTRHLVHSCMIMMGDLNARFIEDMQVTAFKLTAQKKLLAHQERRCPESIEGREEPRAEHVTCPEAETHFARQAI